LLNYKHNYKKKLHYFQNLNQKYLFILKIIHILLLLKCHMINNLKSIQHQIYFIGYHYVLMERLDHNQVNQLDIFGKKKMMQNFGKDIQFNLILFQIHQYAIIWINEHYMQIFFSTFLYIFSTERFQLWIYFSWRTSKY
jgi:hypothetical protein